MAQEKHKCCICGCEFYGWGNNPWGALDENGNTIEWSDDDVCCDVCDSMYVITGRIHTLNKKKGGK